MKLHVRGRLFLASLAVVGVVIVIAGVVAHVELRRWIEARTEEELAHKLAVVTLAVERAPPAAPGDDARAALASDLANDLGHALGVRVTLIDRRGVVVGDSEVTDLTTVANHAERPEVREALAGRHGRDRRRSSTVHEDMLYLAAPTPGGAARVAASYAAVDAAAARLRVLLVFAGAMGLLAAIVMSAVASQLLSRTLRQLVENARVLVGGAADAHAGADDMDEIGGIAGTLQKLGNDLGRAMGTLAAERDRFAAVLDAMSEGVIGLDPAGRVLFSNAAARALLGVQTNDDVGKSILELARVPALDDVAAAARAGKVSDVEIELHGVAASGHAGPAIRRTLLVHARPVRAGGAVLGLHDISDVRRLERVRRDFVANVSHELRTPVSVIRANAETLLLGGLDDKARAPGFVEAIDRNAERLARLVGDLLDLSRIEAGQLALQMNALSVHALALRAVEAVEGRARERGQTLTVDVDEALRVRADAKALDQVLLNLLDNAVKYTQPGGHVTVRARTGPINGPMSGPGSQQPRAVIEVEDDGPGIAPVHRGRLFERFYRVDPGRSRDAGGTGLGLAIVKHLVEAMGGRVMIEPAPRADGRGSLFLVELDAAPRA